MPIGAGRPGVPAPSLFCPHKRLVSVCPLCGSARAGAATPMRGPVQHDVDDTLHAFRAECHRRIRQYLALAHEGVAPAEAYARTYDAMQRRGRVASEEEDTSTFRGGFYRAVVKLFDVTIEDRRIQGYNGLGDWEEMRDYVFRKYAPDALAQALKEGRLLVHGGNGAWPRQQIATDLLRSDRIRDAVLLVAFGDDGTPPDKATDAEVVRRLAAVEAMDAKTLQLSSKVLHVFSPTRWPALTPKTVPDVGEELGFPIPPVETAADYPAFAEAMRAIMKAKGHADLDRTDIAVADAYDMAFGDADEA